MARERAMAGPLVAGTPSLRAQPRKGKNQQVVQKSAGQKRAVTKGQNWVGHSEICTENKNQNFRLVFSKKRQHWNATANRACKTWGRGSGRGQNRQVGAPALRYH